MTKTWQEALADWRTSPTSYGWERDEALFGLIENVHERLTALETARATAPVSDDEIVEALARIGYANTYLHLRWEDCPEKRGYLRLAKQSLDDLRADGYDVVKRS